MRASSVAAVMRAPPRVVSSCARGQARLAHPRLRAPRRVALLSGTPSCRCERKLRVSSSANTCLGADDWKCKDMTRSEHVEKV